MSNDILDKWKQMHGQANEGWGKLTDDDPDQAGSKAEKLIGPPQESYGYTRERAAAEFLRWLQAKTRPAAAPTDVPVGTPDDEPRGEPK